MLYRNRSLYIYLIYTVCWWWSIRNANHVIDLVYWAIKISVSLTDTRNCSFDLHLKKKGRHAVLSIFHSRSLKFVLLASRAYFFFSSTFFYQFFLQTFSHSRLNFNCLSITFQSNVIKRERSTENQEPEPEGSYF